MSTLVARIEQELQVPASHLDAIAAAAFHHYRKIVIPKRRGGMRTIYAPSPELKTLQRWLAQNVLSGLPVHDAAYAYRKERSIVGNAAAHHEGRFFLRLDMRRFFESITRSDIQILLHRATFLGLAPQDIDFVCNVACRGPGLIIGAPTSPVLSNAAMFEFDDVVTTICRHRGIVYTRYADDLFFSSTAPNQLSGIPAMVDAQLTAAEVPKDMCLNWKKTNHMSRAGRVRLAGITLTNGGSASTGRAFKRSVRTRLHALDTLSLQERNSLLGDVSFLYMVEPGYYLALQRRHGVDSLFALIRNA